MRLLLRSGQRGAAAEWFHVDVGSTVRVDAPFRRLEPRCLSVTIGDGAVAMHTLGPASPDPRFYQPSGGLSHQRLGHGQAPRRPHVDPELHGALQFGLALSPVATSDQRSRRQEAGQRLPPISPSSSPASAYRPSVISVAAVTQRDGPVTSCTASRSGWSVNARASANTVAQ